MTTPKRNRPNSSKSSRTDDDPIRSNEIRTNHAAITLFLVNTYPDGIPAVDLPVAQAAIGLANAVDAAPDSAGLWSQYRGALDDLLAITRQDGNEIDFLVDQLRAADRYPED